MNIHTNTRLLNKISHFVCSNIQKKENVEKEEKSFETDIVHLETFSFGLE